MSDSSFICIRLKKKIRTRDSVTSKAATRASRTDAKDRPSACVAHVFLLPTPRPVTSLLQASLRRDSPRTPQSNFERDVRFRRGREYLLAFLDDIYTVTTPERACEVHGFVEEALWSLAGIRVHQGKTQVWNQAGVEPPGCHRLQAEAVLSDRRAVVWRGAEELPIYQRGMKVLGTPLGHSEYIRAQLEMLSVEHQTLLDRIPLIEDVQSAWSILVHCAAARANYVARVVEPMTARQFCERHDVGLWRCLCATVQIPPDQPEDVVEAASMPMVLGGVGLRSAVRVSVPAYWASWMDALLVIRQRHPEIVERLVTEFEIGPHTPFLRAAVDAQRRLTGTRGFEPPSWQAAALGARPLPREPDELEPGCVRQGWQHEASPRVEQQFRQELFSRVPAQVQALIRSQGGPGGGAAREDQVWPNPSLAKVVRQVWPNPSLAKTKFGQT